MKQSKPNMTCLTEEEREVCEILINLSYLIKIYSVDLPLWGAKKRRSAINLTPSPPRHQPPEKKAKVGAGELSPATPLAFSPSESDDKTQHHQLFVKKVVKKKTKEELLETINELAQAKESLTMELEKVKSHHNKLIAYNMELKAKQQELKEPGEPKKSINNAVELTKNTIAPPLLPDNRIAYYPHFSNLLQQQQQQQQQQNFFIQYPCNQTHPYLLQTGLPDLNVNCDEVFYDIEHSQPFDQNVQVMEDSYKAIVAAEARKRRMVRVKERKVKC